MVEHFLMAALLLLLFGAIVFLVCRRSWMISLCLRFAFLLLSYLFSFHLFIYFDVTAICLFLILIHCHLF
jgi:hypothetical protein